MNSEIIRLEKKTRKLLRTGIILFIISSIFIIFLPVIITKYSFVEIASSPNEIGDTLGGIMGPAFAMMGAVLTFMAFWVQYSANLQQKTQFEKQLLTQNDQYQLEKIESRVFKLIDVYNYNISQLSFKSRFSNISYEGKGYFYVLFLHYTKLLKEIKDYDKKREIVLDERIYSDYKETLLNKNRFVDLNNWVSYELAYIIIFYGVGNMGRKNITEILSGKYKEDYLFSILNYFSNKPADIKTNNVSLEKWKSTMNSQEKFTNASKSNFDRFYNGQQTRLAHYFRQIFMIISYIDNQNINNNEKLEYGKNIRSLFSNHEQIILFLNSVSVLGRDWELNYDDKKFISKYSLIKNIPKGYRKEYEVDKFYSSITYEND